MRKTTWVFFFHKHSKLLKHFSWSKSCTYKSSAIWIKICQKIHNWISRSRISILICTTALFNVIWFFFFCVILRNAIASLVHSVKNALRTMNCLIFGAQHQWYKFLIVKKTSCLFSDYKLRPLLLGFIWWYIRCGGATVTVDFCFAMLLDFL